MNSRFATSAALATAVIASALTACAPVRPDGPPAPVAAVAQATTVPERFVSAEQSGVELDSLATWPTEDGKTWLIATAKTGHRLTVFDADSGAVLRTVGGHGRGAGEFDRPNGVAVYGDHLFVVERDNRRVQVFSLPSFAPLGSFGEPELRSPYGLWINETEPEELDLYVTDNFMYGKKFDQVPPLSELNQRVRRYHVVFDDDDRATARYLGAFGETVEPVALHAVESIAGDPAGQRLLIADERRTTADGARRSTLREYTFDGRYTGRGTSEQSFAADAEGVALWSCSDGNGYWIAVDQRSPLTVFHLFDRHTLELRGSFQGETTSYTDGIALHAAATAAFPSGALYAVHADKAVSAFDLAEVARTLDLPAACIE